MTRKPAICFLRFICILLTPFLTVACSFGGTEKGAPQTEAEIKSVLQNCVDKQHRAPGIVVAVIDDSGTQVVAYGQRERGKPDAVDGDTLFEIGSITKVFTTLLLQDMADRGDVSLNDPIGKYLPSTVSSPTRDGKQITLAHLATHTSGLPDAPSNFHPLDADDPWKDYSVDQLYDFVAHYKLPRAIGRSYEYSNVGMGLLGHLLARCAAASYESLVVQRICDPLEMNSTRITLDNTMKSRLARGHAECGVPVKNWGSNALEGDGALLSSANDMAKFLAANMGKAPSPLAGAMAKTHRPRADAGLFLKVGLGWHVFSAFGHDAAVWHNGGTGGYRSWIGFDPDTRRGAVVLANSANDIDDLGLYLTGSNPDLQAFHARRQREVAKIDFAVLDRYIGRYSFKKSNQTIAVVRDGDHLYAELEGTRYEALPESQTRFFLTAVNAQLEFQPDANGQYTRIISHEDGKAETGTRVR